MLERRTRVGAYAVCRDGDDRILLCQMAPGYPMEGRWTLPGGGLDFGEHPLEGVLRELSEETGLVGRVRGLAEVSSYAGIVEGRGGRFEMHSLRIIYFVDIVSGSLRHEVGGSTDRCDWFSLVEAARLPMLELGRIGLRLAGVPQAESAD
jgi:ADP-ribose pyrophosphatase YjhB (NUDIX family)